jgi:hypothetical protein
MNRLTAMAPQEGTSLREPERSRPKLALLGAPGLAFLHSLVCAAGIREGFDVDFFPTICASYDKQLADSSSDLYSYQPRAVLMLAEAMHPGMAPRCRPPLGPGRLAKQQLGAALIRNTILPVLLPMCKAQSHRAHTPAFCLLDAIERRLCSSPMHEGSQLLLTHRQSSPEAVIQWHLPALWRDRTLKHARAVLRGYPVTRLLAALFGLDFFCVVVDMKHHPRMVDRDIASFLLRWGETHPAGIAGGAAKCLPDTFVFIDYDLFAADPRRTG